MRSALGRQKMERAWNLLQEHIPLEGKRVVVLGCGNGFFARLLRDAKAQVDAVDIAEGALETFRRIDAEGIRLIRDYVPQTHLPDEAYDLVVALEILAHLDPKEYRLFFSEIHRLTHPAGFALVSTPLDIDSEEPLERFAQLAKTELEIQFSVYSYNAWSIRLERFFSIPETFVKGWKNPEWFREKQSQRGSFREKWFSFHSSPPMVWVWWILQFPFFPFLYSFRQSDRLLRWKEIACKAVRNILGISHVVCLAKRKPLAPMLPPDQIPQERPKRKQVWE